MTDHQSKLKALGEILDVQDDTGEITTADEPRRAVGEVLRGGAPAVPAAEPIDVKPAPPPSVPPTEAPAPRDPPTSARTPPRAPADVVVEPPSRDTGHRHRGHRTSANLPMQLVERLAAAKQRRRWELSELVAGALDHAVVDDDHVDNLLERVWSEPRVQRAYQLSADDTARLDALAHQWRMNRSQVLAVLLPVELDRLGL